MDGSSAVFSSAVVRLSDGNDLDHSGVFAIGRQSGALQTCDYIRVPTGWGIRTSEAVFYAIAQFAGGVNDVAFISVLLVIHSACRPWDTRPLSRVLRVSGGPGR